MISLTHSLMKDGRVLVICGPAGCGKSTLAHIIAASHSEPVHIIEEMPTLDELRYEITLRRTKPVIVVATLPVEEFDSELFTIINIGQKAKVSGQVFDIVVKECAGGTFLINGTHHRFRMPESLKGKIVRFTAQEVTP